MSTLVQLVQDHKSLDQILLEQDGELTNQQQEQIVDEWMLEIKSNIQLKADGYKYRMNNLDRSSDALRDRASRIAAAAKTLENMSSLLKERMKQAMLEMGLNSINAPEFTFKLSKGNPTVEILNLEAVPAKYTREKLVVELDKILLKEDLKNGVEIPGAKLNESIVLKVTESKKEIK
jgi:hypothetical protein